MALASIQTSQAVPAALDVDSSAVVAALGDVLIPSDPARLTHSCDGYRFEFRSE